MLRKLVSFARRARRNKYVPQGRSLRYEPLEGRWVLSANGFVGNLNECMPVLDDGALNAIVPASSMLFSPNSQITFEFAASDVVSDEGTNSTAPEAINFTLDPNDTPDGATLVFNDMGDSDAANDRWQFSFTPTPDQIDAFKIFLIASDNGSGFDPDANDGAGGNAVGSPLSDVFKFTLTVDDRPVVDLNGVGQGDNAGIDFGPTSFVEADGSAPVSVVDDDLAISFVKDGMIESATIEIENLQADGLEKLAVEVGTTSLEVDSSTLGKLVITVTGGGLADKSEFESVLRTLTYNNTSNAPQSVRTINVTVNDGAKESGVAVSTVNITATNDTPTLEAVADTTAMIGVTKTIELVATDPDGGDTLVFQLIDAPEGAEIISPQPVEMSIDGKYRATLQWTPTQAQRDLGPFEFTISATDNGVPTLADRVDFEITLVNQDPIANDDPGAGNDPLSVGEDDGVKVGSDGNLLNNDVDPDGDDILVTEVNVGATTFPVDIEFTHPTSGAKITVNANGDVFYNPDGMFETLADGQTATDMFEYTISDGRGGTDTANVTVTINGANDAPTATDIVPEFSISEDAGDTALSTASILTGASDVDNGDVLSIVGAPTEVSEKLGVFSFDPDSGILSYDSRGDYDLAVGETETLDFNVEVQDQAGEIVKVAAKIIVTGVNDPPTAMADPDYSTDEDTSLIEPDRADGLLGNDDDEDGDNAQLTVSQVNGSAANVSSEITIQDTTGTHSGKLLVLSDGTFTFNPQGGFDGLKPTESATVTFTYVAKDAHDGESSPATATITVSGKNDAPVANNDLGAGLTINEDQDLISFDPNLRLIANDTDADGDTLTISQINGDPHNPDVEINVTSAGGRSGKLAVAPDGTLAYSPSGVFQSLPKGQSDAVTFTYRATDGTTESNRASATITVTGVNDGPEINDTQLAGAIQQALNLGSSPQLSESIAVVNGQQFAFDFSSVVSDVDTATNLLSFSLNDNVPNGQAQPVLNGSTGQFNWTPSSDGTFTLTFTVIDATDVGASLSDFRTLTFEVVTEI